MVYRNHSGEQASRGSRESLSEGRVGRQLEVLLEGASSASQRSSARRALSDASLEPPHHHQLASGYFLPCPPKIVYSIECLGVFLLSTFLKTT